MRLKSGKIFIKDIRFDNKTHVKDGVPHVSKKKVKTLVLEDDKLADCHVNIARPGESVRIASVEDVIEPRVKVSRGGEVFPGVVGKISPQVGAGRTHVLKGCYVITADRIVGFQEGVIDIGGPVADYCPSSKISNLCLVVEPADGLETRVYGKVARVAGLEVATYLGGIARDLEPDKTVTCETEPAFEQATMYPDLPKIGYIHMLQFRGLLHDTYYYGVDARQFVPTFMYPTEIMDGAIVSDNRVTPCDKAIACHHFYNPVTEDCLKHHGKDINFMGVILTNENVFLADKGRHSDMVAKLYSWVGLDGVLTTEKGYGNPDTDLTMNCRKVENARTEVVLIIDEFLGKGGKSQSPAGVCRGADALASCGQGSATLILLVTGKVIGTQEFIKMQIGSWDGCKNPDGSSEAELQIVIASATANGFNKLAVGGYRINQRRWEYN